MNSVTTEKFWECYNAVPELIKKEARKTYKLFIVNPYHPSLHFKRVHSRKPIFSIRITKNYRALGLLENNNIIWFWIGSHQDYHVLLNK